MYQNTACVMILTWAIYLGNSLANSHVNQLFLLWEAVGTVDHGYARGAFSPIVHV